MRIDIVGRKGRFSLIVPLIVVGTLKLVRFILFIGPTHFLIIDVILKSADYQKNKLINMIGLKP
jgi:hypothetical protein